MKITYIMGHKNPDADSVCSAIAYERLKKSLGFENFRAARCGNSNTRIDRILRRFSAPLPEFVGDLRLRAKDVMKTDFISLPIDASCYSVMDMIDKYDLRTIPLVDGGGVLVGEVSVFDLGEFFIPRPKQVREVRHVRATLNDIIKTLNAKVESLFRPDETEDMYVRIGAMEVNTFGSFIDKECLRPEQNLIVVGDRFDIQIKAIQMGVRGIIITGGYGIDPSVIEMARQKSVSILSCNYDSATTALLVRMATRAAPLMRRDFATVKSDFLLSKVSARIRDYFGKTVFVCNSDGKIEGLFTSTDLLDLPKPGLVLVDHNEISQAVTGADEADIVEIIDHHRIGALPTSNPILFINKPVGSTCTIVSQMYEKSGLIPDAQTAGLLLSGIISDTLNLKSPTSTLEDEREYSKLAALANIDANALADFIFRADSPILTSSPEDVIKADCKHYGEKGRDFSVSQIEELDFGNFYAHITQLRSALENYRKENGLLFSALFVTNVMSQDSLLMVCGDGDFTSRINYAKDADKDVFELPKTVSRKKQLIPYLTSLFRDYPA